MISSRSNSTVKWIRALRGRKARDETGLFFAEGIRLSIEAAACEVDLRTVVLAPDLLRSEIALETANTLRDTGVSLLEVSAEVFRSLSDREGPQGIGVVGRQRWTTLEHVDPAGDVQWVALDALADPGNLGTILRTSDGAGGAGAVFLGATADPYDPAALRAAMGATFSQRLIRADFGALRAWCSAHRVQMIGTSDRGSTAYRGAEFRTPACVVMGSERHGLTDAEMNACDLVVSIPMAGRSDSLNVSVAAGLILYEIRARAC